MNAEKQIKNYLPMTETAYYILLALHAPLHGYGIIKYVEELTLGRIRLGSGTVYGTLSKMQKDQLIAVYTDAGRKTVYEMTVLGRRVLALEMERIKKLYADTVSQEGYFHA